MRQFPSPSNNTEGNINFVLKTGAESEGLYPRRPIQENSSVASDKSVEGKIVDVNNVSGDDDEEEDDEDEDEDEDADADEGARNSANRFIGGFRPKGNPIKNKPTAGSKPIKR